MTDSNYTASDLRIDLIGAPVCGLLFVGALRMAFPAPHLLLGMVQGLVLLFGGLGFLLTLSRGIYEGTTLLYRRTSDRWARPLQVAVVTVVWLVALSLFTGGASVTNAARTFHNWPIMLGITVFVGIVAFFLTLTVEPHPRMRAYLMTIGVLVVLLGPSRYGYSYSTDDDDHSTADDYADQTPQQHKDYALLVFVVYTASCFAGVTCARNAHRLRSALPIPAPRRY